MSSSFSLMNRMKMPEVWDAHFSFMAWLHTQSKSLPLPVCLPSVDFTDSVTELRRKSENFPSDICMIFFNPLIYCFLSYSPVVRSVLCIRITLWFVQVLDTRKDQILECMFTSYFFLLPSYRQIEVISFLNVQSVCKYAISNWFAYC